MKKIAIEEHITKDGLDQIEERLKDMDEAGIDMQVLSYIFPYDDSLNTSEAISIARNANDALAEIVEKYPDRFASFATLALQDPDASADELERAVKELGLKGTMIFSNIGGQYLDNQKFWIILERAEELGVPIYLHPGPPSDDMAAPYMTYPILTGAMWGYSAGTGLHAMRLIISGIFDKYPGLKIILGHLGEGIPYYLWRIDNIWLKQMDRAEAPDSSAIKLQRTPTQYFKDNFYITTSGMFWPPALQFANSVLGADDILFAVDYPPESNITAVQFIDAAPVSDDDKEKICHLNAEKLLDLPI